MERRQRSVAPPTVPGFRAVPFTGVIFVMAEAARLGYAYGHPDWCNLGQGMPETGDLPGAPPRVLEAPISTADQEYAPGLVRGKVPRVHRPPVELPLHLPFELHALASLPLDLLFDDVGRLLDAKTVTVKVAE
jgi:hypothetical protein